MTLTGRMGRWLRRSLTRWTLRNPSPEMREWLAPRSHAGVHVSPQSAMTYAAVYDAVRIYAETIASLPLHLYRRVEGGKARATDSPMYRLFHSRPNDMQTSFQWRESAMVHLLLWGNSYSQIYWDARGEAASLWPIAPWLVTPRLAADGKSMEYQVNTSRGQVTLGSADVLHISGLGFDGFVGRSVISLARESLGLGMAAEQFGAQFFGSGATIAGVIERKEGVLSDEAFDRLRQDWERTYSGMAAAHKVAILEEGASYKPIGIPPEDAQFLQTREFQIEEVARWFNLPPHMLKLQELPISLRD